MPRRPLVAGNWKMHGGCGWTQGYLEQLLPRVNPEGPEVVVCPPYTALAAAAVMVVGSPVALGAQNCHWEVEGAFTGEVSAAMLVELGVAWVIVGHSERRQYFGESDETAVRRAAAAQRAGLNVILCVGETLAQRLGGETQAVLDRQTRELGTLDPSRLTLAYEPVWAIGTGHTATPQQAQEAHAFLRQRCAEHSTAEVASALRILYGGSVKPENAAQLLAQPDVDGALVGGASLDVEGFCAIIQAAAGAASAAR